MGPDDGLNDSERRCVAEAMVDALGVDELAAVATPDEVREGEDFDPGAEGIEVDERMAGDFYDGLDSCIDVRQLFLESVGAGDGMAEEDLECLDQAVSDDLLRQVTIMSLLGETEEDNPELEGALSSAVAPCVGATDAQG